jgi:hypothetical protein
MNWFRRGLTKTAQNTSAPSRPQTQQTPAPQDYWDIGDAGNESIENIECEVFAWIWTGPGGLQFEEVTSKYSTHDSMFRNMNRQNMFYGRFDSCRGQASLSVPPKASMRPTPSAVINEVATKFKRYGLNQIWEFRQGTPAKLVWQG